MFGVLMITLLLTIALVGSNMDVILNCSMSLFNFISPINYKDLKMVFIIAISSYYLYVII